MINQLESAIVFEEVEAVLMGPLYRPFRPSRPLHPPAMLLIMVSIDLLLEEWQPQALVAAHLHYPMISKRLEML